MEREKHNKTHLPHRPWCSICVQARAREDKHYTAACAARESGIAEVAMDYIQVEDTVPALGEEDESTEPAETDEIEKQLTHSAALVEALEEPAQGAEKTKAGTETHKKRVLVRPRPLDKSCVFVLNPVQRNWK